MQKDSFPVKPLSITAFPFTSISFSLLLVIITFPIVLLLSKFEPISTVFAMIS